MWDDQFEELLRPYLPSLKPGETLSADDRLQDLGLDSMSTVNLLIDVEQTYDVSFPDEDLGAETFATARSLWTTLSALLPHHSG